MAEPPRELPVPGRIAVQQARWDSAFTERANRYGTDPSAPAKWAAGQFAASGARHVLELGAGQGRDTLFFADQGFHVTALDYSTAGASALERAASASGHHDRLTVRQHDVRLPLPLPDRSVDACYAHMLFCMALTTPELEALSREVRRVLRPGGLVVYTARTTADPDYGAGTPCGDDMYEEEGFIVHFFDRALVQRLAAGYELLDVTEFEEGALPRRLFRVTQRVA